MSRYSFKEIILFILCVAMVVGIIFFGPFVIMQYWNWFMVPATGFPSKENYEPRHITHP